MAEITKTVWGLDDPAEAGLNDDEVDALTNKN